MKKAALLCLSLLTTSFVASTQATLLVYEGFDYDTGALAGGNGGVGFTNSWANSGAGGDTVTSPGLTYTNGSTLATSGNYTTVSNTATAGSFRDFSSVSVASGTQTYWVSVIAQTNGNAFGASGDEASIQLRNSSNIEILSVGAFGSSANWRIRAKSATGSVSGFSSAGDTPNSGTQAFLLMRVDVNTAADAADNIYLWVDPALGSEPGVGTATASITGTNFWDDDDFNINRVRSGLINSGTTESKTLTYDELRIADSFGDAAPIPEASSAAMSLTALLTVFTALWWRRKRS